ncbi:hypothetical protein ABFA07_023566 [Porites harrisoni]
MKAQVLVIAFLVIAMLFAESESFTGPFGPPRPQGKRDLQEKVQVAARSVCEAARNLGCGGMKLRDADPREKEFAS